MHLFRQIFASFFLLHLHPNTLSMKIHKISILICLLLVFFASCESEDQDQNTDIKSSYIFDIESVPLITLQISSNEWNQLLIDFDKNPMNENSVKCHFLFNKNYQSEDVITAGLRIRGNTSRRRPEGMKGQLHDAVQTDWHHASFSVDFNEIEPGQRFSGLKKLNLKWFKDDPMYVREIYCYDLFERYGVWTAPQSSYTRLIIKIDDEKPAYFGVYELLESVDNIYLEERKTQFGDSKGNLWKANWGADFVDKNRNRMGMESITLSQTYKPVYDYKGDSVHLESAKNQLVSFITNLNSLQGTDFLNWIQNATDVPLLLKTYSVSVLCGMWDDYWVNKNNFYFYFNSAGKFHFIPYDYDNTLGTSQIMANSGTRDLMNWGTASHPLIKKIISYPYYNALYKSYLKELSSQDNDLFQAEKSKERIRNWHNLIQSYITNDTGDDMMIIDKPASWGNCSFYRLLEENNNYFTIRSSNLPQ